MKRYFRKLLPYVIPAIVPVLTLLYGFGEHFSWWDKLSGRTAALAGWQRLMSNKGYPVSWIYSDEPEFLPLEKIINRWTTSHEAVPVIGAGIHPSLISRSDIQTLTTKVPENWPNPTFVPDTVPVMFLYNVTREGGQGKVARIGSLGDIRRWIDESRNQERFYVSTVLLSLLSIGVAIIGATRAREQHGSKGENLNNR